MLSRRGLLGRIAGVVGGLVATDAFADAREKLTEPRVYSKKDFMLSDNAPLGINCSGYLSAHYSGICPRSYGGCSG